MLSVGAVYQLPFDISIEFNEAILTKILVSLV